MIIQTHFRSSFTFILCTVYHIVDEFHDLNTLEMSLQYHVVFCGRGSDCKCWWLFLWTRNSLLLQDLTQGFNVYHLALSRASRIESTTLHTVSMISFSFYICVCVYVFQGPVSFYVFQSRFYMHRLFLPCLLHVLPTLYMICSLQETIADLYLPISLFQELLWTVNAQTLNKQ